MTSAHASLPAQPLSPEPPRRAGERRRWGGLHGGAPALVLAGLAARHPGLVLAVTPDTHSALHLEVELGFYCGEDGPEILAFPDWETLPYDVFSPHQDIVSQRLATLYRLPACRQGILVVPVATLMQRLAPRTHLDAHALVLRPGETLEPDAFRQRLEAAGYSCVSQVMEHGEFAVRGSLIDIYPMGAETPYRIDLLDEEVESIRVFDPETQRSVHTLDQIELLPAREFSLAPEAITRFRGAFRARFEGEPQRSHVYREVSNAVAPGGIEYYLPLFFETTETLFDYLPPGALAVEMAGVSEALAAFHDQVCQRHEQRRHDPQRPILPPEALYLDPAGVAEAMSRLPAVTLDTGASDAGLGFQPPPALHLQPRSEHPADALQRFLDGFPGRVLLVAESPGRREVLLETLIAQGLRPTPCEGWQAFLGAQMALGITVAALERGLVLEAPALAVVAEPQLHGEWVSQPRRRGPVRDTDTVIRDLADLSIGAAVVHEEHGVGRYRGLQRLQAGGVDAEYMVLEYAEEGRLYVPVASLQRVSRYTGAESPPLHRLGGEQWERARRRAAERARDAAAELLDIYARRQARPGHTFEVPAAEYGAFAAAFPFEETPDQQSAIAAVIQDMRSGQPMDRVVCGDVGFGKTEVAMRAAFVAVADGRQVAVLVPTTLLAQQHYQNFLDRFADWPVRVEQLSRFGSRKGQEVVLTDLAAGKVDILIGTHKLLQPGVKFRNLGLAIVDEEHRFGVRQKERFKALRAEVDVLTLTATPIPRTLNMALAGLRDLSVIATPPAHRLAIKTFVGEWNSGLIQEACQRELKRGGQVYFLHNDVESIQRQARDLEAIVPGARVAVAHGQMRERELEQVMLDFYHQRSNLLVCTTIIESGIDIPTANTIIINRADKLGLAQLHQLRGRVGRSHHRAYAYLVVPPRKAMTADAVKRIEAIETLEDLGAGFMLASHDLEIRGAGELLGEEQSGQIHEVGFTLYMELLERAVQALKAGRMPELEQPLQHGPEVDLQTPALIPEDYLPDVHARLIMYKRIASARSDEALRELQVEMIDRFGLLPEPAKSLFKVTRLKILADPIGVRRIEAGPTGGRIVFDAQPRIDVDKLFRLLQTQAQVYRLDGQDKLRFSKPMPAAEDREQEVARLLESVAA